MILCAVVNHFFYAMPRLYRSAYSCYYYRSNVACRPCGMYLDFHPELDHFLKIFVGAMPLNLGNRPRSYLQARWS